MNSHIIQLKKVTFAYPANPPVLENINLEIAKNEFVAIFGPNGSAKTTLFKIMLGLLKPQTGTLKIGNSSSPEPTLGYLPQKFNLNRSFPATVREVLKLTSKKSPEQINAVLQKLDLQEKSKTLFGNLSGGQLQRVLLARTLLSEPQILFLDEPTNNLDESWQKRLYQILDDLHNKGMTILTITHNLQPLLQRATRFLYLEQKKVTTVTPPNLSEV